MVRNHQKLHPTQIFRRRPRFNKKDVKYLSLDVGWPDSHTDAQRPNYEDEAGSSIISYSTNATADNIPGPGRLLDNLYQFLGRRLERLIMRLGPYDPQPSQILHHLMKNYSTQLHFVVSENLNGVSRRLPNQEIAGLRSLVKQTQSVLRIFSSEFKANFDQIDFCL